ncbi:T9SS type A sorting domain-containing protein [bacterium]|nr:T9SS type A sorting domain-containing protein [bacterium]
MKTMARMGITGLLMLCLTTLVSAQVLADFEVNESGFGVTWTGAMTGIARIADPTGRSEGVLEISMDGSVGGNGAMHVPGVDFTAGRVVSYLVYLASEQNIPDSVHIKVYAQDNDGWTWMDHVYYAVDIPKDVWYPVVFDLGAAARRNPAFIYTDAPLQRLGIEFGVTNETDGDAAAWTGSIYVDDCKQLGAAPTDLGDFEVNESGFGVTWTGAMTGIARIADPTGRSEGVLEISMDGSPGGNGAMHVPGVDFSAGQLVSYMIYMPSDQNVPDSVTIKVYAQDNDGWTWMDHVYHAKDIPKDTWYPVVFDLEAASKRNPAFVYTDAPLQRLGIEFGVYDETDGDAAAWTGVIYVDDVQQLNAETGDKWVVCAFENPVAGVQGFVDNKWGAAITGMERVADPTGLSDGVLAVTFDFSVGDKGTFQKGGIDIYDEESDTYASQITFDIYVPADLPDGASICLWVQDATTYTFSKDTVAFADFPAMKGQWTSLTYDVGAHVTAGDIVPENKMNVGSEVLYYEVPAWAGTVYWDNLTLVGINPPEGEIVSPLVQASVQNAANPAYQYVNIQWVDNTIATTYEIYFSTKRINNLDAEGVIRLADDIPSGVQVWTHRPFTRDGSEVTYYYAVVANSPDGLTPLTAQCKAGPFTLASSVTAKAVYDGDFGSKFVLDGLDNEFTEYAQYKLQPENAGGDESAGWTVNSTDLTWNNTFVIDDDYLYISADVTDDDLNATAEGPLVEGTQPWQGDALEFFIGYYNANLLDDYHKHRDVDNGTSGDWRIAFTAWGTTGTASSINTSYPGVETTVFQKFTGDGYIIEARIALDSLALDGDMVVVDGAMMPMQINCNDLDPSNNDETRTLQANWGGSGNQEAWLRPGCWAFLEVLGGPTGIAENEIAPRVCSLSNSYPNPFNPRTRFTYELAERSDVKIMVYDMLGKRIKTLVNTTAGAGAYQVEWDGTNDAGLNVASGIYFCRMVTPDYTHTTKMMLVK